MTDRPEAHLSRAIAHLTKAREALNKEQNRPREERVETHGWLTDAISDVHSATSTIEEIRIHLDNMRDNEGDR